MNPNDELLKAVIDYTRIMDARLDAQAKKCQPDIDRLIIESVPAYERMKHWARQRAT